MSGLRDLKIEGLDAENDLLGFQLVGVNDRPGLFVYDLEDSVLNMRLEGYIYGTVSAVWIDEAPLRAFLLPLIVISVIRKSILLHLAGT